MALNAPLKILLRLAAGMVNGMMVVADYNAIVIPDMVGRIVHRMPERRAQNTVFG